MKMLLYTKKFSRKWQKTVFPGNSHTSWRHPQNVSHRQKISFFNKKNYVYMLWYLVVLKTFGKFWSKLNTRDDVISVWNSCFEQSVLNKDSATNIFLWSSWSSEPLFCWAARNSCIWRIQFLRIENSFNRYSFVSINVKCNTYVNKTFLIHTNWLCYRRI